MTVPYTFASATSALTLSKLDANFAAVGASNNISYTPAGTGAVVTTVQTKLRESVSVKDFGAVGDDTTDDTAAIQAAISSISLINGGSVYFPAGRYKVTSQLNITTDNLTLHGDGQRSSTIRVYHNTGYGIRVQDSVNPGADPVFNFSMLDMCVRALVETTANACVYLNNVLNCAFDNVSLEDHFGGLLIGGGNEHYYSNFMVSSARSIYWPAAKANSFYLKIDQSSTGDLPYNLYLVNFNFQRNDTISLVNNGVVINCADGVWFSNGHIQGVAGADLWLNCTDSTKQISGIFCNNVWFDSDSLYGVRVTGSSSVVFQQVELTGCNFLRPLTNGVLFDAGSNCQGIQISGGWMIESGSFGVLLNSGTRTIINGMFFGACNRDGAANTSAIAINSGVDNVTIQGCEFNQTANSSTTSPLMQGIRVSNAASENILVTGNAFRLDPAMPDIVDASTLDTNAYPNNITTKTATATSISGSSLVITEIGDVFSVAAGLNFSNLTGRWYGRQVVLRFLGASTVSQGTIRLAGSTAFVAAAGDTLSLTYESSGNFWYETSRMVAGAVLWASNNISYTPAGTGAVVTTVQTKLRESVSVKDFGAVGDGVADDTAAIQAAINAGAPSGKTIFFPAGVYRTTATVGFTKSDPQQFAFRVVGENSFYTTIRADHSSGPVLALNRSLGCVSDICLDASATRTAGAAGSNYGLLLEGPDVAGGAVATMTITRVRILNQPSHGLVHAGQSQLSYYEQVLCQSNKGHGFVFSDGTITGRTNLIFPGLLTLTGCWSILNTGHGLVLGSPSETVSPVRFLILNCEFSDNALTAGVRYSADEVWISGLNITIDTCAMGRSFGTAVIGCIRFAGENLFIRNQRAVTTTHTLRLEADHIIGSTTGVSVDGLRVLNNAQNPVVIVSDLATVTNITVNTYGGVGNMTRMFTPGAVRAFWDLTPPFSDAVTTATQTVNNTTTLVDVTQLAVYLAASESVFFEAVVRHNGDVPADIKIAFVAPAGATVRWDNNQSIYITSGDAIVVSNSEITEGATRAFGATTGTRTINIRGWVVMSTTPGALQMQFAQNTATAVNTNILAGSMLRVLRRNTNV